MGIRTILAAAVPEAVKGRLDFYRSPERGLSWGGPFNGQVGRREIFDAIIRLRPPALVIETGTYLGATTELFARTGIRVVTIESQARNYGFSKARLRNFLNVELYMGDSRKVLMEFFDRIGPSPKPGDVFVYLDAHWQEDLPLAEELEAVFGWDRSAIVMIDDFQVPDDPGYNFDDYGMGKALTPLYIESVCRKFDLATLFPSLRSDDETGSRRGCAVLAHRGEVSKMLLATGLLRELENIVGIEPRSHALP